MKYLLATDVSNLPNQLKEFYESFKTVLTEFKTRQTEEEEDQTDEF